MEIETMPFSENIRKELNQKVYRNQTFFLKNQRLENTEMNMMIPEESL